MSCKEMEIFAAHNPDATLRHESSAGGVFTMLAEEVLGRGGVVYGAGFDSDWHIVHRRVDTVDGLKSLRGSKYAFSEYITALKDANKDLAAGRSVLFSGTPCQIAAIDRLAGNNPQLLKVEVVCHGAPKQEYWMWYLSELCDSLGKSRSEITSISFRDKSTGWKGYSFTVKFNDGTVFTQPHDDNLYMRAFLADLTLRDACFRCPFKYPHGSHADITLGDFWGISRLAPDIDNNLGTTLVISRTHAGDCALQNAGLRVSDNYALSDVARYNPAISNAVRIPVKRQVFQEKLAKNNSFIDTVSKIVRTNVVVMAKRLFCKLLKQR